MTTMMTTSTVDQLKFQVKLHPYVKRARTHLVRLGPSVYVFRSQAARVQRSTVNDDDYDDDDGGRLRR